MNPRLKEKYNKEIVQSLMTKLNFKNINAVPKIEKIVLNMGLGQEGLDKKKMEICIKDMSSITGQQPVKTKFKKSISNFKSRKGSNAGLKVTLRKDKMYEFLDRLVNIALPRIKDFRGLSSNGFDIAFSGDENFTITETVASNKEWLLGESAASTVSGDVISAKLNGATTWEENPNFDGIVTDQRWEQTRNFARNAPDENTGVVIVLWNDTSLTEIGYPQQPQMTSFFSVS
mgnify:CR=1 FL=1